MIRRGALELLLAGLMLAVHCESTIIGCQGQTIEARSRFVEDGVELLEYLQRRGKYAEPAKSPRPGLILLDLNMPRMDGREALGIIKDDRNLRAIRVIIMTTSKAEQDIVNSYDLSASSYITKPVKFESLVDVVKTIGKYWLEIVELPPDESDTSA